MKFFFFSASINDTNMQIHKYTNTQIHKYKYTNTQIQIQYVWFEQKSEWFQGHSVRLGQDSALDVTQNSDLSFELLVDYWILSFHSHGGRSGKRFMAPSEDFSHWPFDGAKQVIFYQTLTDWAQKRQRLQIGSTTFFSSNLGVQGMIGVKNGSKVQN